MKKNLVWTTFHWEENEIKLSFGSGPSETVHKKSKQTRARCREKHVGSKNADINQINFTLNQHKN